MTPEAFRAACLALPGATLSIQWGGARVFKVGGRMFAMINGEREPPFYSFKASDMAFELLVEHGLGRPAPYLQRARWVRLTGPDSLPDAELAAYLAQAHAIVAERLTRLQKRALGLG